MEQQFGIKINGIEHSKFTCIRKPSDISDTTVFEFTIALNTSFLENLLLETVKIDILLESTKVQMASMEIVMGFDVLNLESLKITNQDGEIRFPGPLLHLIRQVALGTARGIMHVKLSGTFLSNVILPIIAMDQDGNILPQPIPEAQK